jgi:hypothetical protein
MPAGNQYPGCCFHQDRSGDRSAERRSTSPFRRERQFDFHRLDSPEQSQSCSQRMRAIPAVSRPASRSFRIPSRRTGAWRSETELIAPMILPAAGDSSRAATVAGNVNPANTFVYGIVTDGDMRDFDAGNDDTQRKASKPARKTTIGHWSRIQHPEIPQQIIAASLPEFPSAVFPDREDY